MTHLRRANEILKAASVFFARELDRQPSKVSAFIEQHRERFGVEPICSALGVSASAYYERVRAGARPVRSTTSTLFQRICQLHEDSYLDYGSRRCGRRWCAAASASAATASRG